MAVGYHFEFGFLLKPVGDRVFGPRPISRYLEEVFHVSTCSDLQSHTESACQAPKKSLFLPTPASAPSSSFPLRLSSSRVIKKVMNMPPYRAGGADRASSVKLVKVLDQPVAMIGLRVFQVSLAKSRCGAAGGTILP